MGDKQSGGYASNRRGNTRICSTCAFATWQEVDGLIYWKCKRFGSELRAVDSNRAACQEWKQASPLTGARLGGELDAVQ